MMKYTNNQNGRSMIEMLGVLAIVGVLSVAGVMAFNKGMEKYKTDKVMDQISDVQHNLQELYNKQQGYRNLTIDTAVKLGVFPEEMLKEYATTGRILHAGGGEVTLTTDPQDPTRISVSFSDLPKGAAVEMATQDWSSQSVSVGQDEASVSGN